MDNKHTKKVKVGKIYIGGDSTVSVQSMTNTDTRDIKSTLDQVLQLEANGCDIVRLAIFDEKCPTTIREIKKHTDIPIVADIHFDYKLAINSIENGVDKLRINPGNIGSTDKIKKVVDAAKDRQVPIRIGVNGGSLKKDYLYKYGNTPTALAESALEHVNILENLGFEQIVISVKSSNVIKTVEAYRYISEKVSYPLHLGVTEAGTPWQGTIKSSIGIGALLLDGIGDTLRVSLTGSPIEEVKVGMEILKSLGLRQQGIEFISCPTCGRCNVDLVDITNKLQKRLKNVDAHLKVAVMGCVVNGPGEAKEADIGIAGGKGKFILFKKGQIMGSFPQQEAVDMVVSNIQEMIDDDEYSKHNIGI